MNSQSVLHAFNFETKPFDGDPRQAHQFIPYLQTQLGAAKLSYLLNTKDYPTPQPEEFHLLLETQHQIVIRTAAEDHKRRIDHYMRFARPLYERAVQQIEHDADIPEYDKPALIAGIVRPPVPTLIQPQSEFTAAIESQLSKAREKTRQFDADADQAIQVIRKFLSPRIQNQCAGVLNATDKPAREKLLVIWKWLQNQRIFDPHIVSEIKQDMNALPEITDFSQAIATLGHINMLQTELQTLQKPMSDSELIMLHCSKMSTLPKYAEQFVPIKLKYLQNPYSHLADLPPSFDILAPPRDTLEPRTWATYSSDIAIHARAHNSTQRTATVLAAHTSAYPRQESFPRRSNERSREYRPSRDARTDFPSQYSQSNRPASPNQRHLGNRSHQASSRPPHGRDSRSLERSQRSQDKPARSRSRDRSRDRATDRPRSSSSSNTSRESGPRANTRLPYLPEDQYRQMQSALMDVMNRFYPVQSSAKSPPRHQAHVAISDFPTQEQFSSPPSPEPHTEARVFGANGEDSLSHESSDAYDSDAHFHDA